MPTPILKTPVLPGFQNTEWKHENTADQFENKVDGQPHNTKREQDQPDQRQQNDQHEGKWPAKNKKNTPKDYCYQGSHNFLLKDF
jgi:hypothetical protein